MLSLLFFSLQITFPIAILVLLGIWFRHLGWLTEEFNQSATKLVFNVALPCIMFVNIVQADVGTEFGWQIIAFAVCFILASFVVLSLLSRWITSLKEERGVFIQGAYRGNIGIIGLSFCFSTYGIEGATLASIYLAVLSLVYNILAVMTLSRWAIKAQNKNVLKSSLISVVKNPLIIAICIAGLWSYSGITVPKVVISSAQYLSQLTLPLALLCIGSSLSWKGLVSGGRVTAWASALKLIILPFLAVAIAHQIGFTGVHLGVMYLMMATPTAAASYMMVRALGGNVSLAASIIAVTTVFSLLSTSLGLMALRGLKWI